MDIRHDEEGGRFVLERDGEQPGLEHAGTGGYRVRASCWFVAEHLDRKPGYRERVAG